MHSTQKLETVMKQKLIIFFTAVLTTAILTPLRGGYFNIGTLSSFQMADIGYLIVFFPLTLFILNRYSQQIKLSEILALLLIGSSWDLVTSITHMPGSLVSMLDFLCRWAAIIAAFLFYKSSYRKRLLVLGSFIIIGLAIVIVQEPYFWFIVNNVD